MTTTTIIKTVFFAASRETVWSFLTDKDKLGEWYHPAEADLAAGEPYALYKVDADGARARLIWGRVLEMQPFDRLLLIIWRITFGKEVLPLVRCLNCWLCLMTSLMMLTIVLKRVIL